MKHLYLPLAVLGLVVPVSLLVYLVLLNGFVIDSVLIGVFSNPLSTLVFADLAIATLVFWVFLLRESRRLGMKNWGWFIFASLLVGLSFSFPLFMHLRERRRAYLREKHAHHTD